MKSVLISIQPKWVEKIASGKKTVEVRKTRPKLETPFKCYIYETVEKVKEIVEEYDSNFKLLRRKRTTKKWGGKVIGEFVCDRITALYNVSTTSWNLLYGDVHDHAKNLVRKACLTEKEIHDYAKGKDLYAWHISDLKIYDKPKELSEFFPIKPKRVGRWTNKDDCAFCKYHRWGENFTETCLLDKPEPICEYTPPLEKPPQSWCYVESLGE